MNIKYSYPMKFVLGLFLLLTMLSTVLANDPVQEGLDIALKANKQYQGFIDYHVELEMVLRNERDDESHRQMEISTLEVPEDGDKTLIIFKSPIDQRGTALLSYSHKVEPDDQFLYLPAIKRVKRIASENKSGPFVGSEFAYEDIVSQELEKFTYKYVMEDKYSDIACFVVDRFPLDRYSGYTHQRTWYDKDNYLVRKIDYYDRKETLLKTLTLDDYRVYNQFWRSHFARMSNHQTGKTTDLLFSEYTFTYGLNDADFSVNSLKRSR